MIPLSISLLEVSTRVLVPEATPLQNLPMCAIIHLSCDLPLLTPAAFLRDDLALLVLPDLAAVSFGGRLAISGGVTSTSSGNEEVLNDVWSSVDLGGTYVIVS